MVLESFMITGSIVALVTPMFDDGSIDYDSLAKLVDWHVEQGTAAIVAVGTTGESATLRVDEHCEVIRSVVDVANGRIKVIAGTGANATEEAIELTQAAKKVGADACLSVTPYYNKPTQQGLYLHHKTIAEAVDIPNILYNVPGRTAVDMSVETTDRLSEISNIIAIKDATGDLERGAELIERCGSKIAIYSGDDATAAELIMMGAKGNISVTANVVPAKLAQICELAAQAKSEEQKNEVRDLDNALQKLHDNMFVEANPIPVKWALFRMGLIKQGIRLPMTELDVKYQTAMEKILGEFGLI